MTKPTVEIGIPAFNEEANIKKLLESIFAQNEDYYILTKVIVNSDGSEDLTVQEAKKISDPRLAVMNNKDRRGQAHRQNELLQNCKSDILVLLNADILLEGKDFINRIIIPVVNNKADIVSSCMKAVSPKNYFESILVLGVEIKNNFFSKHNNGVNAFTCHGAARALSKRMYTDFRFSESVGEDAYSYFFAISRNYKYHYSEEAICYIRCPNNLYDHVGQSTRFFKSTRSLGSTFGKDLVKEHYSFSKLDMATSLKPFAVKDPLRLGFYMALYCYTSLLSRIRKKQQMWTMTVSSKTLS